jgi:SAM-dependent methyltransferase
METVVCPLCGSSGAPSVEDNGWHSNSCDCGVIFVTPRPLEGENPWSHAGLQRASYGRTLRARLALRIMGRYRPAGRLIDFGAGGGQFLQEALKCGYDASAVEVDPALVAHFDSLGIPCSPSLDGEVDVIYACDVLSHLRDPLSVMRDFNNHLRPGGLLVLETGNFPDVNARYFDRLSFNFPDHLYFFGESATVRLLSLGGFVVHEVQRFDLLPSMWLGRRKRSRYRAVRYARRVTSSYVLHAARYGVGRISPKPGHPQTIIYVATKSAS